MTHDPGARLVRVTQLLADYAVLVDARRAEDWADLFTADGALVLGERRFTGRAELTEFAAQSAVGVHLAGLPSIDDDAGTLLVRSKFVFVSTEGGRLMAGTYVDRVNDDGTTARFEERTVEMTARMKAPPSEQIAAPA